MWGAFVRIYQLLQRLMPMRVMYDTENCHFFVKNSKCWRYRHINGQCVIAWNVASFRMLHYLRSEKGESGMTFIDFVNDMLLWAITLLELTVVLSYRKRDYALAWCLNQYIGDKHKKDEKLDILTLILYSLVGICLVFPIALAGLPFIFDNTSCHVMVRFYLPDLIMKHKIAELAIMVWYYGFHAFIGMIPILVMLTSLLCIVFEACSGMKPTYIDPSNAIHGKVFTIKFRSAMKVYRQEYLKWECLMQFGFVLYPALIVSAYLINVVTTFACLKLYNELPVHMIGMLALIDVAVLADTWVFHVFALVISYDYEKFIVFWKRELLGKRSRMVLRTCLPIKTKIGLFLTLDSDTFLATVQQIVDMTMTLLLA